MASSCVAPAARGVSCVNVGESKSTIQQQRRHRHRHHHHRHHHRHGSVVTRAASRSDGGGSWVPPPGRLDEGAARDRVMQLASGTPQGRGALEAVQGCISSMPGATNNRLMLFRYPGLKCPLDTVALNLVEPRWVVAFDMLANAPRRPGDPPFCFGITHPALTPAKTPPGGREYLAFK